MLSESIAAAAHIGRFALFHVSNGGDMGHPAFYFFNDDSSEAFDSTRCDCRRRLRKHLKTKWRTLFGGWPRSRSKQDAGAPCLLCWRHGTFALSAKPVAIDSSRVSICGPFRFTSGPLGTSVTAHSAFVLAHLSRAPYPENKESSVLRNRAFLVRCAGQVSLPATGFPFSAVLKSCAGLEPANDRITAVIW